MRIGVSVHIGKSIRQRRPPRFGLLLPNRRHLIPCLPHVVRLPNQMLEIFFQFLPYLDSQLRITSLPAQTPALLHQRQRLLDLLRMTNRSVRDAIDAAVLVAYACDYSAPHGAVEAEEVGNRIEGGGRCVGKVDVGERVHVDFAEGLGG